MQRALIPRCSALDPPMPPPPALAPTDPDHPQWVRRRRKLNIMFGSSLATFLGVGIAAIVNMAGGRPIDPNGRVRHVAAGQCRGGGYRHLCLAGRAADRLAEAAGGATGGTTGGAGGR